MSDFFSIFSPEMMALGREIGKIAGYTASVQNTQVFLRYHDFITNPPPTYIREWRSNRDSEQRWYLSHVGGIGDNVRGGLSAAHYHADRLEMLEREVERLLKVSKYAQSMQPNQTIGIGDTSKISFEYQAFILALRRSLDYLAVALSAYFKQESNSFRTFSKSLPKKKGRIVAEAIELACRRHESGLAFILATGRQSVRNRIAHYDFVSAGCVNLTARGFFLAGGGEDLTPDHLLKTSLNEAVRKRLAAVEACITDVLDSFVEAARTEEAENQRGVLTHPSSTPQ